MAARPNQLQQVADLERQIFDESGTICVGEDCADFPDANNDRDGRLRRTACVVLQEAGCIGANGCPFSMTNEADEFGFGERDIADLPLPAEERDL